MFQRQGTRPAGADRRRLELVIFLILSILVWPVIAVGVVGGWGFAVWMLQQVYGPPGPPSHA